MNVFIYVIVYTYVVGSSDVLQMCVYSYVLCVFGPFRTFLGTCDRVCLYGRDQLRSAFL